MLFSYNVKINAGDPENDEGRVPEGSKAFGREIYPEMASISTF